MCAPSDPPRFGGVDAACAHVSCTRLITSPELRSPLGDSRLNLVALSPDRMSLSCRAARVRADGMFPDANCSVRATYFHRCSWTRYLAAHTGVSFLCCPQRCLSSTPSRSSLCGGLLCFTSQELGLSQKRPAREMIHREARNVQPNPQVLSCLKAACGLCWNVP